MNNWKLEKIELKLRESLRESIQSLIYFDVIEFSKYNLQLNDIKPLVEKYATFVYNNNYKYGKTWVVLETDRIKIEKR